MKPLGLRKRGAKRHPHNECDVCNEKDAENKGKEKNEVKKQIESDISEMDER